MMDIRKFFRDRQSNVHSQNPADSEAGPSSLPKSKDAGAQEFAKDDSGKLTLPEGAGLSGSHIDALPEEPYQPDAQIIPVQCLLKRKLKFQNKWFEDFPWSHYDTSSSAVLCFFCVQASKQKLTDLSKRSDDAFLSSGFKNWKKTLDKFKAHQRSHHHKLAVGNLVFQKEKQSVSAQLSTHILAEQSVARKALLKLITSLKFLAQQGLAVRGHHINDGNFQTLLELRGEDDEELRKWIGQKISYTSPAIQNEILQLMSNTLLRSICNEINTESQEFGIVVDGTQDIQGVEQECVCIRYVTNSCSVQEKCIGLYEITSTTGKSLSSMVTDVLLRLGLPIENLRSQTYDGASNMSGMHKGCQAEIKKLQPLALYVHCGAHVTHLIISKAVQESQIVRNALDAVQELGTLYKESGKFKQLYLKLHASDSMLDSPSSLKPICPTRWLTRSSAVKSVLMNYGNVIEALTSATDNFGTMTSSRANGLNKNFSSPHILLGLLLSMPILDILERFKSVLQQGSDITVAGMLEGAETVKKKQLEGIRTEEKCHDMFEETNKKASELGLDQVSLPRPRKVPKKYDSSSTLQHTAASAEDHFRIEYFKVIDSALVNLKEYFSSTDLKEYCKLTDSLLTDNVDIEALSKYPELSDSHSIKLQLSFFKTNFHPNPKSISECQKLFQSMKVEVRRMFPLVEKLLRLILISPASSCSAERSFSALRRLKTYMRSSMSQKRLNHVMMCHIHKDRLSGMDPVHLANLFINESADSRRKLFGRYEET